MEVVSFKLFVLSFVVFLLSACGGGGSSSDDSGESDGQPVDAPVSNVENPSPSPAEETPVEETPVEETPVEETPVEETPVEETPVEETPVEETPVEETPVEETPVEETPVEETPVEETPVEETPVEESNWYKPTLGVTWQWQLSGIVNTGYDVEIYDVDLFDVSKADIAQLQGQGRKVICYFSAGSYEEWRNDAKDFNPADLGKSLDGWPGERWLDINSENVRSIMRARLDLAKTKGCDGVEPDNVDGYSNDNGVALTANQQLNYNKFLAAEAHTRNLSIALKNDVDQVAALVDFFDFSVNEECFQYNECETLLPFIIQGKPVLNAEYKKAFVDNIGDRQAMCGESIALQFSTLVLPLNLDDEFRHSCL